MTGEDLYAWARRMAACAGAGESVLGQSVEDRPLRAWTLGDPANREVVVILGRQHPP